MGQKLLAYLFYGFLVLMVIAALFLLKYQLGQKAVKQQQIDSRANVVSRMETESTVLLPNQKQTDKSLAQAKFSEKPENRLTKENANQPLTYLQFYRQLQQAQACQPLFKKWQAEGIKTDLQDIVRPAIRFYGEPDYLPNEPQPITGGQQTMLNQWQTICLNLWHDYGIFSLEQTNLPTLTNDITADIERLLNTLPTKTAKETAIKHVLKTARKWQQSFNQLTLAFEGEDSVDEAQLMAWNDEIQRLKTQRIEVSQEFRTIDNPSEEDINNITDQQTILYEQIRAIEKQIKAQKVVNKDTFAQAESAFESQNQALNKLLYSHDGDVFYEVLRTLEDHRDAGASITSTGLSYTSSYKANSYRISPGQMVLEHSKWHTSFTQFNTLKFATHLYLCDLGWDCGADSVMMLRYCLLDMHSYAEACGLDVRTFYQQHLISANHMTDVEHFKNLYTDLFYE